MCIRLEGKKDGFVYCATLFGRLVRTSLGVDMTNYLDCFLCICLNYVHFDKQSQIVYLNPWVTLAMLVDFILVKCHLAKYMQCIYQMAIVSCSQVFCINMDTESLCVACSCVVCTSGSC